jgi:NAD(P)-dependent dehydrogenase (short-subunit alcohol dehydrogenase family)
MTVARVAVVTGAASGIGRATTELLVARGVAVVAVDLDDERLAWASGIELVATVAGDVCSEAVNERAVATAVERFGRLDVAVLNAGIPARGDLIDAPLDGFDRSIDVNVRAVLLGIRACVPAMRRVGGGRISVTASTSGLAADPSMWAYNAAKGAVINLVRAAAVDLAAEDITVNAVCPGPTETGMTAPIKGAPERHDDLRRAIPAQRWGRPEEIAAVIAFVVSPEASFLTGAVIPVDGGITANTGQFRPVPRRENP